MREFMKIVEKKDDRDMMQKLRDMIDHPNTEQFIRDIAQRKLDKLLAAQQEEERAQGYEGHPGVPALNLTVQAGWSHNPPDLPKEKWDDVYLAYKGKKLTYRMVIERLLPLHPFKIVFDPTTRGFVGPHVKIWFHPEDEPANGAFIEKILNAPPTIRATVDSGDAAKYLRGGQAMYYAFFNAWRDRPKFK